MKSSTDTLLEIVVSPPALYLLPVREHLKPEVGVAAQNVFHEPKGAFTGEISPAQLLDASIDWAILGHSERRQIFQESDDFVGVKVAQAVKAGIKVIACIGESLEQREANDTSKIVRKQLDAIRKHAGPEAWKDIVIAYEPIWSIGTGKVASPEQAQEVHADVRKWIKEAVGAQAADATRVIYGGSVNGKNCAELAKCPDIDGFLVGGASLKPEFIDIINVNQAQPRM